MTGPSWPSRHCSTWLFRAGSVGWNPLLRLYAGEERQSALDLKKRLVEDAPPERRLLGIRDRRATPGAEIDGASRLDHDVGIRSRVGVDPVDHLRRGHYVD